MADIRAVEVTGTIRLGQFLKLAGLVEQGADAKDVVASGEVTVNGRAETRRGRQLADGDVVAFGGDRARVVTPDQPGSFAYATKPGGAVPANRVERRRPPGSAEMSPAERSKAGPTSA